MKSILMIAGIFVLSGVAFAQDAPNAYRPYEIGWNLASYSRQGSVNLYGGDLSFTVHATHRIGIVSDLAVHQSISTTPTIDTTTFRFGPKFVVRRGSRVTTFGEVLVGGTRLKGSVSAVSGGTVSTVSATYNGFALAFGAGIDIGIRPWVAIRAGQFDFSYLRFGSIGTSSNGLRAGVGLVFRMGH